MNRNRKPIFTRRNSVIQSYPLVSLAELRQTGQTPTMLRATANSLERIARKGYEGAVKEISESTSIGDNVIIVRKSLPAYDAYKARATARHLRRMAKLLQTNNTPS